MLQAVWEGASPLGEPPTDHPTLCHLGGLLSGGWDKSSENLAADHKQSSASQLAVEKSGKSNENPAVMPGVRRQNSILGVTGENVTGVQESKTPILGEAPRQGVSY